MPPGRVRRSAGALLLNFDGVLWRRDAIATGRIEAVAGLAPTTIDELALARSAPAILGQASRAAWLESIAAGLAAHVQSLETAEKLVDAWYAARGSVAPEVLWFIAAVREAGTPVGVCVTGIDEVPADLPAAVDVVVDASALGVAVPHPEFFATACRALAVLPKQCLYVDGAPRHIAGARASGLLAYRYGGVESLSYLRDVFADGPVPGLRP